MHMRWTRTVPSTVPRYLMQPLCKQVLVAEPASASFHKVGRYLPSLSAALRVRANAAQQEQEQRHGRQVGRRAHHFTPWSVEQRDRGGAIRNEKLLFINRDAKLPNTFLCPAC